MSVQYINSSGDSKALFLRPQHATAFSYSKWFLGVALCWTTQVQQMHQEHSPVLRELCSCPPYLVGLSHLCQKQTLVQTRRKSVRRSSISYSEPHLTGHLLLDKLSYLKFVWLKPEMATSLPPLRCSRVVCGWGGSFYWVTGQSRQIISFPKVCCFLSQRICLMDDEMSGLGMSLLLKTCWLLLEIWAKVQGAWSHHVSKVRENAGPNCCFIRELKSRLSDHH